MDGRPAHAPFSPPGEVNSATPSGGFVHLDGEGHYRIASYHRMAPFMMSLASDSDLWMFVTSGGGLTAGRVDAGHNLFPYLTVDRLHDAHHHTGPITLVRILQRDAGPVLWEPFSDSGARDPQVERNLYKNVVGSRLVFEEIHHEHELAVRACWSGCDEFGWVHTVTLENQGSAPARLEVLDGLRNVVPFGAPLSLYQQSSNLVDAYKKSEIDVETGLGIFSLTAGITDRAEALEVLAANTVWFCGPQNFKTHLSLGAVDAFRKGRGYAGETVLNGTRGNYLVSGTLDLDPGESSRWRLVADVEQDHVRIAELRGHLIKGDDLDARIGRSLRLTSENLVRNVGSADGIQATGHLEASSHHFANVLFNNMRGGVFARNHQIPVADFQDFLETRNRAVARRHPSLAALPESVTAKELRDAARSTGDADFERLCHEFLPLHFGRRHGDPSRPWNHFSIQAHDDSGERILHYEGNWRDIFQNWEALCTAFPDFLPHVVAKFVNASTVDGFNPYRITQDGVDWETVNPDDPWSNIGYWGDHQIVYLTRLLESSRSHAPGSLGDLLGREMFSYAEVPYILKPYEDIVRNPSETIEYDKARAARIEARVEGLGTDGKLLTGPDGSVRHVNLLEKLLVPALSKLSNLVPDAGIWMNTQRPEWNDANNALGGGGVSVVTLCYLRRYMALLSDLLEDRPEDSLPVSTEVAGWFKAVGAALEEEKTHFTGESIDSRDRKRLLDTLGAAFSEYRDTVYTCGFTGTTEVALSDVADLCRIALTYLDLGIRASQRPDGLYHSYNLLDFSPDGAEVEVLHLQEMLEGQVAALSSGVLDPQEALDILDLLFASPLFRTDQNSFMLYPERVLPSFLDKNVIPGEDALAIPLLRRLLEADDRSLITRDDDNRLRFNGLFRNAQDLRAALEVLGGKEAWTSAVADDERAVLDLFESVFRHKSYTGRSGVMYGYEGLGCIYWHMVAKLLLAIQEIAVRAEREDRPRELRAALAAMYYRVRKGLGFEKTVGEYGAFPTDPYSHTPPGGGAKQPGMTGQVKEEILTRRGELGVFVENGTLRFDPFLLRTSEFLDQPREFHYVDVDGDVRKIDLKAGNLAFTVCQVPVVFERTDGDAFIRLIAKDGETTRILGDTIDAASSAEIFSRSGGVDRIMVGVPADGLINS